MRPLDGVPDRAAWHLALRRETQDELEGPWDEGYACQNVLARRGDG